MFSAFEASNRPQNRPRSSHNPPAATVQGMAHPLLLLFPIEVTLQIIREVLDNALHGLLKGPHDSGIPHFAARYRTKLVPLNASIFMWPRLYTLQGFLDYGRPKEYYDVAVRFSSISRAFAHEVACALTGHRAALQMSVVEAQRRSNEASSTLMDIMSNSSRQDPPDKPWLPEARESQRLHEEAGAVLAYTEAAKALVGACWEFAGDLVEGRKVQ